MTSHGPWSVKGIDQRAREAAREAAREEGLTIGEYINRMLLEETGDEAPSARDTETPRYPRAVRQSDVRGEPAPSPAHGTFDKLIARLEAVEARSTLALTGIDQSIVGLVTRLNRTDAKSDQVAENVEAVLSDINATHEKLQDKVRALEEDDSGARNLETLKSLEQALGKLASHIYEENNRRKDETSSVRARVETGLEEFGDRVGGMEKRVETTLSEAAARVEKKVEQAELRAEGTARHLSERFSELETNVSSRLARIDSFQERIGAVEGDVAGALTSIESVMTRMQERLQRAEAGTNAAMEGLERTFETLDKRIDTLAEHASPEAAAKLREQFESRFEGLAAELKASIEATRQDLAREIEDAAAAGVSPDKLNSIDSSIEALGKRMAASEERTGRGLETVNEQVGRISSTFDRRLRDVEARDPSEAVNAVREDMQRLSGNVTDRLEQFSTQNDEVIDKITEQMKSLADQFESRIEHSEYRSASAIEQVGEQVASVAQRLQARQERAFSELKSNLDTARRQQDIRLSDALTGVSDRIEQMQRQSASALSPVQKAIASLATRLEELEDFTAPPHADRVHDEPPHFAPPPVDEPRLYDDEPEDFDLVDDDTEEAYETDFSSSDPNAGTAHDDLTFGEAHDEGGALLAEMDEPFEAGLPDVSEVEDAPDEFRADDGYQYETELLEEPDVDEHDPLSALVDDWDDGRDETRESDIFGEDDVPQADADEDIFAEDEPEAAEASETVPEYEVPLEEDREPADYLSRARQAALSATAQSRTSRAVPAKAPRSKGGKLPLVAAVSVVALATAAAGTMLTLRGLQDDPGRPVVQAPPAARPADAAPAALAAGDPEAVTEAALTGEADPAGTDAPLPIDEAEAAAIEDELFDAPETPAAETPVAEPVAATPQPEPAPAVNFAALPRIPASPTLETSADGGDPAAQLMLGEQRLEAGDYTSGPSLVRKAAEQGEPAAQYRLAKLHEKGLGVPRDLAMARQWTERAAEGGNVKAMHDLAVYYAEGEGGPQNYAAAAEWFRKAADFGLTDSQYNLAVLYEAGLGISPSATEALYWYEVAGRQGDEGAPAKVEELRAALSLDAAQQAQRRAAAWLPSTPGARANGTFGNASWTAHPPAQISAIQSVLAALGYEPGPADGVMGSGTVSAIEAYQADVGRTATGEITPDLIDSLNETVAAAAQAG